MWICETLSFFLSFLIWSSWNWKFFKVIVNISVGSRKIEKFGNSKNQYFQKFFKELCHKTCYWKNSFEKNENANLKLKFFFSINLVFQNSSFIYYSAILTFSFGLLDRIEIPLIKSILRNWKKNLNFPNFQNLIF